MPTNPTASSPPVSRKKRKNKGRRQRRQSFAGLPDEAPQDLSSNNLYMQPNTSNTSLDSEALLDHREQRPRLARPRRTSTQLSSSFHLPQHHHNRRGSVRQTGDHDASDENDAEHENAPLLSSSAKLSSNNGSAARGYGTGDSHSRKARRENSRPASGRSGLPAQNVTTPSERYNVNFPPSIPGSPTLGSADHLDMSFGDALMRDELVGSSSRANSMTDLGLDSHPDHPSLERRHTIALQAEEDVCFPQEGMSELGDEELRSTQGEHVRRRRKQKKWPDLNVLDEWYRLEKEGRSEGRTMKITEPQLVGGRLRPVHKNWYQTEHMPYRFTYFNEEVQSTIHSATISELVQPEGSFKDLFIPDPPILPDSSDESDDDEPATQISESVRNGDPGSSRAPTRKPSLSVTNANSERQQPVLSPRQTPLESSAPSREHSGGATPVRPKSPISRMRSPHFIPPKEPRYGDRPIWWLDVLSPTEQEMKYISKAFGIHPLTSEDIMLQEQREKVELFKHYYFVNYRTFDQDEQSENHLEPINMYVVVFREGVISFHFSQTPHPANVRRRIRQLKDFMVLSADWISYAIIDDITDVYLPLIQAIEDEVDDIDDKILELHSSSDPAIKEKQSASDKEKSADAHQGGDMLRRVGDCRKKVMRLFRLLGNKADVIKGFAKRCNENWDVAPRSEIGLYLGDIQDHIVTMTGNLGHYEAILARCHSSYIAQINIKMNERQEATASGLNSLTILGTIVLPMNIVTGLWGMNVWVPGQEFEGDLTWFFAITAGLLLFGLACYWMAKAVYKIG